MMPGQPRAMVVEDERAWQQILSEILVDVGLSVDVAGDAEEAVAALRAAPHRLAVVDLALGGGDYKNQDGLVVLSAIRQLDPGCVAIMLTGYATVELAVSVLSEHGAFTCLRKEAFDREGFRQMVGRALASQPPQGLEQDAPEGEASPQADEAGICHTPLALVVEDDAGWRSILGELLADAGYEAHLSGGYGEALGRLRRANYALAVIDLSLASSLSPKGSDEEESLDGYRLLTIAHDSGIPAIVVSGVATPEEIERAYDEGHAFACLEKQSFSRAAFLAAIDGARQAAGDELGELTPRELEVLALLAQGMTNKEIGQTLVITANTVKRHLKAIFAKLDVRTRAAATAKAIGAGLRVAPPTGEADP